MINYAQPHDTTRTATYFSQVIPGLLTEPHPVTTPVGSGDDVRRDSHLTRFADAGYTIWPGESGTAPHAFHDFTPEGDAAYLPPTITSFYGHEIVAPYGVDITPLSTGHKTQLVVIDFIRADGDQTRTVSALAWQGDNDTFHLTEPLPHEHEYLGVYPAILFGKRRRALEEKHDWHLGKIYYGDTAILDVDVSLIVTPGVALRA